MLSSFFNSVNLSISTERELNDYLKVHLGERPRFESPVLKLDVEESLADVLGLHCCVFLVESGFMLSVKTHFVL